MQKIAKELVGVSAASIILSLLRHGDSYGYDMIMKVREFTNGKVQWHQVGIYPVLRSLEKEGKIRSYWKVHGDRPRKYFTLLEPGLEQLRQNRQDWDLVESLYQKSPVPQI